MSLNRFWTASKMLLVSTVHQTVMQEQGHYIIEGLLLGITDFLSKIKKKFEEIRNLVTEKMDNIKSSAVSKVNEMKKRTIRWS